jgi:hypothetical protein
MPRISIVQTKNNSNEKLHSIYSSYLKNWAKSNGLFGEAERIFCSENGDGLLDATFSIYKYCEELFTNNTVYKKNEV